VLKLVINSSATIACVRYRGPLLLCLHYITEIYSVISLERDRYTWLILFSYFLQAERNNNIIYIYGARLLYVDFYL